MRLISYVPGFEGPCKPTWLSRNQVHNRLDHGTTGFFRRVRPWGPFWPKYGPEFHGIVLFNTNLVTPTTVIW